MRFAIDTNVVAYAVGEVSPFKQGCVRLLELAGEGALLPEASVELLQEFLHIRSRRTGDRAGAALATRWVADLVRLHPLERSDALRATELFAHHAGLDALDAMHAATCLNRQIPVIVSADRAFDAVADLQRLDPREALAVLLGEPQAEPPRA